MVQVPGVAEINTWGGYEKQLHVVVDPFSARQARAHPRRRRASCCAEGNRNAGGGVLEQAGEAQLIQGQGSREHLRPEAMVLANVDGTPIHCATWPTCGRG
jgi:cobalt-zinc-cadmium resistance protein CzcA